MAVARAGIGKGTVYEYFQSKEQAIGEALLYMWEGALNSFARFLEENRGFKEFFKLTKKQRGSL